MKIFRLFITSFIFLILILSTAQSQTNFSLYITGGFTAPMGDFKQDVPLINAQRENWPYQMKTGYHVGIGGLLPIEKKNNINFSFGITYTAFSNNIGTIDTTSTTGSAVKDANVPAGTPVTFSPRINLYTVNLGVTYIFSPKQKFHPLLSLDATGNFFSGNFSYDGASSSSTIYQAADLKSSFRFGLQFGGGLEYRINDGFGVVASLKYNLANLLGKSDESSANTASIAFGDKAHTRDNGEIVGSRSISYLQISFGAVFYLKSTEDKK